MGHAGISRLVIRRYERGKLCENYLDSLLLFNQLIYFWCMYVFVVVRMAGKGAIYWWWYPIYFRCRCYFISHYIGHVRYLYISNKIIFFIVLLLNNFWLRSLNSVKIIWSKLKCQKYPHFYLFPNISFYFISFHCQ